MKDRADEREALSAARRVLAMLNERAPVFAQSEDGTVFLAAKKALGNATARLGGASNNERATLAAFSRWAQNQKYLPLGAPVEASQIKKLEATTTVTIFPVGTVAELMAALLIEKPVLAPYAALGFFAGVRPAELARLRFEEALRWNFGDIEITAEKSKTGFRRLTKMQPNLAGWMAPYRETVGLIAPCDADEKLAAFAKAKGFGWPRDMMRHSFISYAVALTQQIGQVALWAGNSASIVKRHYLARVTEEEGRAYFAILPSQPGNVVPMRRTAKG